MNRLTEHDHVETKNQWARDDPAFVVVLVYFLMVRTLAVFVYGYI